MISYVLWYLIITAGLIAAFITIGLIWFRFPDRSVHDVADYLLPIDFEKAEALLDPQSEATLRKELAPDEFRALQRKRIHHYVAIVQRMAHNSAVLIDRAKAGDGFQAATGWCGSSLVLFAGASQARLLAADSPRCLVDLARPQLG